MPEPVDPRLTTVATRLRSLRVELDRLDDSIGLLHRDDQRRLVAWTHVLRDSLDGLDGDLETMAADGQLR